jgi:NADPH-dependent 2,4-dienoyl-CoA reductase/sulfur reductase-like enzyme/nitrite reductase/ring-hydroxylating ferredoxin subunit
MKTRELVVGKERDFNEGQMRKFEVSEDEQILLAKVGGKVYAVGGNCPHYGAELADGVLSHGRIRCPWHHAAFEVQSGNLVEPPSLNCLARFETSIRGDDVVVTVPEEFHSDRVPEMATCKPEADARTFIIVGAGAAGCAAAQSLRQEGYRGRIVMITREGDAPYDRPMLSKEYLEGEADAGGLPLRSESFYSDYGIELKRTLEVVRVDADARSVSCANGEALSYDKLLLATGGIPRTLDVPGAGLKSIFTLRSVADCNAIIQTVKKSDRCVIVGASFIGMEAANAMRKRGRKVTVIAPESTPFESTLGSEVGSLFKTLHEKNGAEFVLGTSVAKFEGQDRVQAVVTVSGERIPTDFVILGVGVVPATDFVQGLETLDDGSIKVDNTLYAGKDIYAAGDIASFPDPVDGQLIRVEHWTVALNQGIIAGGNMGGKKILFDRTPFFWTNQVDLYFRYVGYAREYDDVILQGEVASQEFLALYVKNNRIVAAAGNNKEKELAAIHELMTRKLMPRPEELRMDSFDWLALL